MEYASRFLLLHGMSDDVAFPKRRRLRSTNRMNIGSSMSVRSGFIIVEDFHARLFLKAAIGVQDRVLDSVVHLLTKGWIVKSSDGYTDLVPS